MKKSLILRISTLLLVFLMLFSFVGCGQKVTTSEVWEEWEETISGTESDNGTSDDGVSGDENSNNDTTEDTSSKAENSDNALKTESSDASKVDGSNDSLSNKEDTSSKNDNSNNVSPNTSSDGEASKDDSSNASESNKTSTNEDTQSEVNSQSTPVQDEISKVYGDISLKVGNTPVENGLNLGGKEYTMAVWNSPEYLDDAFKNKVKAFQSKFNCKIKVVELGWDEYLTKLNQATVSGKPYDIVFIHGSMYANGVTKGLYADLSKQISTADLVDEKNKNAGGIDMSRSAQFSYENGLYGLTGSYASAPYMMYYNKLLFSQYFRPNEDPYTLYKNGEWTWDKIFEMAKKVVNPSRQMYMFDASCVMRSLVLDAGGYLVKPNGDTFKENLTDPKVVKGVQFFQDLFSAENGIASTAGGAFDTSEFYAGHSFIFCQESIKYSGYAADVADLTTFGKSKDNLGVVPYPIMDCNDEGLYPTGWLEATAACKGVKEDRLIAAVAWAKFSASYTNPVTSKTSMTKEQSDLVKKLATGKIIYPNYGFASTSTTLDELYLKIPDEILQGKSVSTVLSNYRQPFQDCINSTFN